MEIRSLEPPDLEEAVALVRSVWQGDPVFGRADALADGRFKAAYVAVDAADRLVGVSEVYRTRHAHRFVNVTVAEPMRRKGVGTGLLEAIRRATQGSPLATRVRPWDLESIGFFRAQGLQLAESAWSCIIDPSDPLIQQWVETKLGQAPPPLSVTEAPAEQDLGELARVMARWYERVHSYSAPQAFTPEEAFDTFIDRAFPWSVTAVEADRRIVGGATLLEDPFQIENDLAHLSWVGTDLDEDIDEQAVVALVYAEMLRRAKAMRKRVRVEISTVHPAGRQAISTIPVEISPELHILADPI